MGPVNRYLTLSGDERQAPVSATATPKKSKPPTPSKRKADPVNAAYEERAKAVLRDALMHLTRHGMDAPRAAHREALAALRRGNREEFTRWTAICRTFDRRAARALDRIEARQTERDGTVSA